MDRSIIIFGVIITDKRIFEIRTLPTIEMYGGDMTPWEITLLREDGSKLAYDTGKNCTVKLTFAPVSAVTQFGFQATASTPVLSKTITPHEGDDGGTVVFVEFSELDTIKLRGKFVYQLDISRETDPNGETINDHRICQGWVVIMQNIDGDRVSA